MNAITEEIFERLMDLSFRPYRLSYGYFPKEITRNSIQVALRRLEKKGFIEKGIMEDEVCIRLTEIGVEEFKRRQLLEKEKSILKIGNKSERWDKVWRVVVFDIPEKNKRIRHVLREALKLLDFWPLQKSVWISKKNYTKELRRWVRELGLSSYILIFETKDLGSLPTK